MTVRPPGPCTTKQIQHSQGIFLLSGFTYPHISNQDNCSHETGYELVKLTHGFLLHIHMKGVALVASDQSQLWMTILSAEWLILQKKIKNIIVGKNEEVTHTMQYCRVWEVALGLFSDLRWISWDVRSWGDCAIKCENTPECITPANCQNCLYRGVHTCWWSHNGVDLMNSTRLLIIILNPVEAVRMSRVIFTW